MWRVYLVVHTTSGRVYIGQCRTSVEYRWKRHCGANSGCPRLSNALKKYGRDAFRLFELGAFATKAEADDLEIALIAEHDATEPARGFNMTLGGDGSAKVFCIRGHRCDEPETRTACGHCRACERMRAQRRKEERHQRKAVA